MGGDLNTSGGSDMNIIGILDCATASNPNNTTVWYDAFTSTNVIAKNLKPFLEYWREIRMEWDAPY